MKALLAVALVAAPVAAPLPHASYFPANPIIKMVSCDYVLGTAFVVGPHTLLTAKHVTSNEGCQIDGEPVDVVSDSASLDFAVIHTRRTYHHWLPIDCTGFRAGEWTYAHGHGKGYPGDIVVVAHATGFDTVVFDGEQEMAVLEGNGFIHGQSGGPVMTSRGVTGVVNAASDRLPFSFSRALKDTAICQHS